MRVQTRGGKRDGWLSIIYSDPSPGIAYVYQTSEGWRWCVAVSGEQGSNEDYEEAVRSLLDKLGTQGVQVPEFLPQEAAETNLIPHLILGVFLGVLLVAAGTFMILLLGAE